MISVAAIGLAVACGLGQTARAAVKLPPMISSHMVLQRDMAVPIWGTAAPGEKVTVKFRDQQKETTADAKGAWMVKLDPLKAGGPDTLTVNAVTLDDVLVGEVWVGAGHAMDGRVSSDSYDGDGTLLSNAAAVHPRLRLISAFGEGGGKGWMVSGRDANRQFSALLIAFGLRLQQELDVPVGLVLGAMTGTQSGLWLSKEAYESDAACREAVAKAMAAYDEAAARQAYAKAVAAWDKAVEKAKSQAAQGITASVPPLPVPPPKPGECRNGFGYSAAIGGLHGFKKRFMPYAIRGVLWDQGEVGTGIEGVDPYTLMGALIRNWRTEWGQGDFPFLYVQQPGGGGCAWDDADPVARLADKFEPLPPAPPDNAGKHLESHLRMMEYPGTAMVISSDLCGGRNPANRFGYGARAARVALGMAYGRPVEIYGPLYQSHTVEGGKVRVRYTHVGQGLAWRHGEKLQGFAVAGADRVFHWADAAIEGDAVVVSSAKVPAPVAARYAWCEVRPWANLFNKDGLPAVPFRTDKW